MGGYLTRLCQRFKVGPGGWTAVPLEERAFQLRMGTNARFRRPKTTSGLVGYLEGEPVGWCAVKPTQRVSEAAAAARGVRNAAKILRSQRLGGDVFRDAGRDIGVQGITRALVRAAVGFARERGARALEGYPMISDPGEEITWGETHVGTRNISMRPASPRWPTRRSARGHAHRFRAGSRACRATAERRRQPMTRT